MYQKVELFGVTMAIMALELLYIFKDYIIKSAKIHEGGPKDRFFAIERLYQFF